MDFQAASRLLLFQIMLPWLNSRAHQECKFPEWNFWGKGNGRFDV